MLGGQNCPFDDAHASLESRGRGTKSGGKHVRPVASLRKCPFPFFVTGNRGGDGISRGHKKLKGLPVGQHVAMCAVFLCGPSGQAEKQMTTR